MWKTNTSDVYLAARTLGGAMKASFHERGRCHVRTPLPKCGLNTSELPAFALEWDINPSANYNFPFAVIIPEQELRIAEGATLKDKGTIWVSAPAGGAIQVALFLVRSQDDLLPSLQAAGWHTTIVDTTLSDGRRLLVSAGDAAIATEKLAELEVIKANVRRAIVEEASLCPGNPRLILINEANVQGARTFVEAAIYQ